MNDIYFISHSQDCGGLTAQKKKKKKILVRYSEKTQRKLNMK